MLDLFVLDGITDEKIPAFVETATEEELASTKDWQTSCLTSFAVQLPNKVALRRSNSKELL